MPIPADSTKGSNKTSRLSNEKKTLSVSPKENMIDTLDSDADSVAHISKVNPPTQGSSN